MSGSCIHVPTHAALAYSIISPIINGLSLATFFLFYHLWKFQFLWQVDGTAGGETGGLFFPKAIQHIFVGLYIQQICLAALFFLARDENQNASAIPEGALMIVDEEKRRGAGSVPTAAPKTKPGQKACTHILSSTLGSRLSIPYGPLHLIRVCIHV